MQLQSQGFDHGDPIPAKHGANADNVSPPLNWDDAPDGTKSFALICEDPDAPGGTFVHWSVYNIPRDWRSIPEDLSQKELTHNVLQGTNDAGTIGYFGPKPPESEQHQYRFRLFALNSETSLPSGITGVELLRSITPNIVGESEIIGMYGVAQ